ncbi:DUF2252 domain-containing protein [Actinospica sp. MGRD01-02]|uniref:DUF2252 domain-containing protein n=1 Tax=Actinospica acidithermotolerans TaxID=2828514 RepID=A0A941EDT2_9ACTN|nr:DUF2252 domain-containing protein [Actinospica acidithermotolerans]MBR7830870.1 DUF2252 domain-containing protein [Actinospica acidithermotolerans]
MTTTPSRPAVLPHPTPEQRAATGGAARVAVPPASQAQFAVDASRLDPVAVLEAQGASRVPELVPIRYGRMLVSPFTFYRGAAAVMAADLARTPSSGLEVQLCGDAHLLNFGLFGSPERRLVFDLNDFDETHPGPWEWDVKRLAASLEIAARENGFSRTKRREIQLAAARGYQEAMNEFAGMHDLDVWYARADVEDQRAELTAQLKKARKKKLDKTLTKARTRDSHRAVAKLTEVVDGQRRIISDPPLIVPVSELITDAERADLVAEMRDLIRGYRSSVQADRRVLLEGFEYVDMARKVVGVGSVGTRCWIILMRGRDDGDPLFLQVKEAQRSVIAEYGGIRAAVPDNEGERVVTGQRLMQASSDIFLGWQSRQLPGGGRRDFYVRQLADWKGGAVPETMIPAGMVAYARLCGWTVARAHARSGDRIAIAAYLGEDTTFANAIAEFSVAYADQNERDHAALQEAERSGRVKVERGL